ncbi:hypothetical protein RMATCC62417_14255 [Rhizopus microsporus]|nr:hypothetical protein RMATCC62417_14255 [Rhizopus microsporus]
MSIQFLYEDAKKTVADEYGRPEPMDYIVDEEQYRLETLSSYTQYLSKLHQEDETGTMQIEDSVEPETDVSMRETSIKRNYTLYTDQDKVRFFKLLFKRCLNASAAAKQLVIHVRTAQRWEKQYDRDPNSIFEKLQKTGRPCLLNEEHKKVILDCIDRNPSTVLEQMMKQLRAQFRPVDRNSKEKIKERLDWIHESAFHINMKRSMAWSKKGSPAMVKVPKTRAQTATILGAISVADLVKCSLRLPQSPANKKRKRGDDAVHTSKGIVTGHYINFLKAAMDGWMDQYSHMKGYYLVMDNAPIHTFEDIARYML